MITLVALQGATAQDTVVSIAARDGYDLVQVIAAASVAAMALAVLLFIAYTLFQLGRFGRSLSRATRRISADPGVEAMRRTADNVEAISRTLNAEVAKLSGSISQLSDRLTQASDRMEERIEEFNAFMEVVQDEAEGVFVDGAATARGVRAGLGDLGGRASSRRRRPARSDGTRAPKHPQRPSLLVEEGDDDEIETEGLGPSSGTESGR